MRAKVKKKAEESKVKVAPPPVLPPGCPALLSKAQICFAIGVSSRTFDSMLAAGEYPCARYEGRRVQALDHRDARGVDREDLRQGVSMAGVFKRKSDKARGKSGKWTCWYYDTDGKRRSCPGTTDKAKSLEIAQHREAESRRVREGIVDAGDRVRVAAGARPVAEHIEDYRLDMLARGDGGKHASHIAGAIRRLLADAGIGSVSDLAPDRIQAALGRLKAKGRSARTCNHALGAVKAFALWLEHANRIKSVPKGLGAIRPYNEDSDRRRVRRALTTAELARLLTAAETGEPVYLYGSTKSKHHKIPVTGPERATLYRIAMGTGFRADELRTLTPERFHLDGDTPTITVLACYSKNGKEAVQPITRELAAGLRAFLATRPPGAGAGGPRPNGRDAAPRPNRRRHPTQDPRRRDRLPRPAALVHHAPDPIWGQPEDRPDPRPSFDHHPDPRPLHAHRGRRRAEGYRGGKRPGSGRRAALMQHGRCLLSLAVACPCRDEKRQGASGFPKTPCLTLVCMTFACHCECPP